MKKTLCILLILNLILTTGCFNYRDANKLFFSLAAVVDVDDNGNLVLYSENFKAYRGQGEKSGSEIRVVFKGVGKTIFDAYSNIIQSASFEIDYTQLKAIVFTERAAREGLQSFIDQPDRDQKTTLREFLFIYEGDPQELLDTKIKDEQFLGLFLDNLMVSQGRLINVIRIRLDEFLNRRMIGSQITVLPIIHKVKLNSEERLALKGAAVIRDDKMIGKLELNEVVPYNMVVNDADVGVLVCQHPLIKGKYVSYKILRSDTKISIFYDGKTVHLKKNINTRLSLVESRVSLDLTNDNVRNKMVKDIEEKIEKECHDLFYKYKEKGIDIYNIQKVFKEKYPNIKVKDVLAITELETSSKVQIEGSNDTTNFR